VAGTFKQLAPWGAAVAAVIAIVLLARNETRFPQNLPDNTVVATLGSTSAPYPLDLREAAAKVRDKPEDPAAAVAAARMYLDYGRTIGDARFVGAALGVLQPWLNSAAGAEILNLGASARQYMHDFEGALQLLDQVIAADPRNAQALLSRANIRVVQGRLADASADCIGLAQARRPDLAILCDTTTKALTSEAPQAYERLDRLVSSHAIDPALTGYARSLLAEIARFLERPEDARRNFEMARSSDPGDLRTLMIFADLELSQGRPKEALQLLQSAPATDSIMVRQAIAAKAIGDEVELARLKQALRGGFEAATAAGETAHAREAARYWLEVEGDAKAALAVAQANWINQREMEDALLLIAAAAAAGQPQAAALVEEWATAERVVSPIFLSELKQAKPAGEAP
jgi:tetratricopeptide (TPR) repeat protein